MGMYTLFHASFCLKTDAPIEVKNALFLLSDGTNPKLDHPFFKCARAAYLFGSSSAYFYDEEQGLNSVKLDHEYDATDQVVVRICSSFKNYDDEIKKFVDWISPYIDLRSGPVIYSRYEETNYNYVFDFIKERETEYIKSLELKLEKLLKIHRTEEKEK